MSVCKECRGEDGAHVVCGEAAHQVDTLIYDAIMFKATGPQEKMLLRALRDAITLILGDTRAKDQV